MMQYCGTMECSIVNCTCGCHVINPFWLQCQAPSLVHVGTVHCCAVLCCRGKVSLVGFFLFVFVVPIKQLSRRSGQHWPYILLWPACLPCGGEVCIALSNDMAVRQTRMRMSKHCFNPSRGHHPLSSLVKSLLYTPSCKGNHRALFSQLNFLGLLI